MKLNALTSLVLSVVALLCIGRHQAFYSQIYPFPLSYVFPWKLRKEALAKAKAAGISTEEQVSSTEIIFPSFASSQQLSFFIL